MVTATMLAEASGPLADRDYAMLRTYTGAAPVTKRSGKRLLLVQMRYACKHRLRQALYHWARTSIQHDDAARAYYAALRHAVTGMRAPSAVLPIAGCVSWWRCSRRGRCMTLRGYGVSPPHPLDKWWEVSAVKGFLPRERRSGLSLPREMVEDHP